MESGRAVLAHVHLNVWVLFYVALWLLQHVLRGRVDADIGGVAFSERLAVAG